MSDEMKGPHPKGETVPKKKPARRRRAWRLAKELAAHARTEDDKWVAMVAVARAAAIEITTDLEEGDNTKQLQFRYDAMAELIGAFTNNLMGQKDGTSGYFPFPPHPSERRF